MALSIKYKTKIRVNGQEYSSVDEMPPEIRQAFERAMAGQTGATTTTKTFKVVFNGQEYNGLDQMPAAVRQLYETAMAAVEQKGDAIPNLVGGSGQATAQPSWQSSGSTPSIPAPILGSAGTRAESTGPRFMIAVGAVLLLLALLALGRGSLWP
jgi:hypothetical protein